MYKRQEEIPAKLWPLPVSSLLFAGKAATQRLKGLGIYTVGDLAHADRGMLAAHMKKHGLALYEYAWGRESDGMFDMEAENKGCGNSVTTPEDVTDLAYARQILLSLCETVGIRLRADHKKAGGVSVGMRTSSFENSSRQLLLDSSTDVTEEIFETACRLLNKMWDGKKPLRLLQVTATRLTDAESVSYTHLGGINGSFMMRYPPERSGWMSGAGKRLIFSLFWNQTKINSLII